MDRETAWSKIRSSDQYDRLQAARFFSRHATASEAERLREVLSNESVFWVKNALRQALDRAIDSDEARGSTEATSPAAAEEAAEPTQKEDIYTAAVEETTSRLLHEIQPVLGTLAYAARSEIGDFDHSDTKAQLDHLKSLLGAIKKLSSAASSPSLSEFDLSQLVRRTANSEVTDSPVPIERAGPSPFIVVGDERLIEVILQNAVRNSVEATEQVGTDDSYPPVVVNWGETEKSYWVAVLDEGRGLPTGGSQAFEIGSTTKKGHLGMGLAVAKQAIQSLSGSIDLQSRSKGGGARLKFRWPKSSLGT